MWQAKASKAAQLVTPAANAARDYLCAISRRTKATPALVFLGAAGVGKGTYAGIVAGLLGLPHVVMGDLVRRRAPHAAATGALLPDDEVAGLLHAELRDHAASGVVLDGFPRTREQAERLDGGFGLTVPTAVLLTLRETALTAKCLGRRVCKVCGRAYNIADVFLDATADEPAVCLPALAPPERCPGVSGDAAILTPAPSKKPLYPLAPAGSAESMLRCFDTTCDLTARADDTDVAVIRRRLRTFAEEGAAVLDHYRRSGRLLEYRITHGVPETTATLVPSIRDALAASTDVEKGGRL